MERYWFLTWTTYGSWLPGDGRGFTSKTRDSSGETVRHNEFGTPMAMPNSPLENYCEAISKADLVRLNIAHADALLAQFQETATFRTWRLLALAIMVTHIHLGVAVVGDPDPEDILRDFKAYGSRRLNRTWGKPPSETWWTASGSKRKLSSETSVVGAIQYLKNQPNPLLIWTREEGIVFRRVDD